MDKPLSGDRQYPQHRVEHTGEELPIGGPLYAHPLHQGRRTLEQNLWHKLDIPETDEDQ